MPAPLSAETPDSFAVTPNIVLTHGYDALGRRTSSSASVDSTADYSNSWTYDGLSRVTQLRQTNGGGNTVADKQVDLTYNDRGQFATITRYEDLYGMNEVVTSTYSYDARGRLTGLDHSQPAGSGSPDPTLADYTWTYDAGGRLTQATSVDGTSTYSYDATSQLTAATHSFQTNETYSYDANGNRIAFSSPGTGGGQVGVVTGTNNQLLNDGTHTYEYDAEGNRTAKETIATGERVEYAWDHHNRLTGITYRDGVGTITKIVAYTYDVWDRRIRKAVDDNGDGSADRSETFLYDEAHPSQHAGGNLTDIVLIYADNDGDGSGPSTLSSRLLHGPAVDQVFTDEQTNGELYWLLTDHQGTVRDLASYDPMMMQTTVANHRTFDSYGNLTSESNPSATTVYGYTSRETDSDADLTYYRARWYDTSTGRFVSEDPLGLLAGDTNIARYVRNRPSQFTDGSGLWPDDPTGMTPDEYEQHMLQELLRTAPQQTATQAHSEAITRAHQEATRLINQLSVQYPGGVPYMPVPAPGRPPGHPSHGSGPCYWYANYFWMNYQPPADPGALSVGYQYWTVNDPNVLAQTHVAVSVQFTMSPTETQTIYLDVGQPGAPQGSLGGANNMFLPNSIPNTMTPQGPPLTATRPPVFSPFTSTPTTLTPNTPTANTPTSPTGMDQQSIWQAMWTAFTDAIYYDVDSGWDPLTNGGYGPGH